MTIKLYKNKSDTLYINKNIELVDTITGTLRGSCSILVPNIKLEMTAEEISSFNYLYIEEFSRYYYVVSVDSLYDNLWSVGCEVDVLMTYREQLLKQSAIIARQENLYNLYLDDDRFMINAQRMIVTKEFPNKIPAGNADENTLSYVFTVAGGKPVTIDTE